VATQDELVQRLQEIQAALKQRQLSESEIEEALGRIEAVKEVVAPIGHRKSTIKDLKGLGKEIWQSIDVDEYIREERRSWR
jgi:hypothetical protein